MTRLRHLTLSTADPAALRSFYAETLGLPVSDTDDGFAVAVGASSMDFRQAEPGRTPTYHVAFTVPGGSVDAAAAWLGDRSPLLSDDGRTQFRYEFLDATAVYAVDPAGNVLELIARTGRDGPTEPFGPHSLLDVAEVGIVVEDVPEAAAALDDLFDLQGSPDEEFAYLGGDDGAFVLVAPGRPWYPTDTPAKPAPLTVVAAGRSGTISFADGPVSVVGVTDP
ncbi:VOC family protein [Halolamina sp.]|uniref:VOC family protein n=1 Tax=Halolamina sp. TaxID=1940283 RepID=UPI000223BB65|nr:Glyoxalase/bleomycin resistance protein/dioxygenase [halophilic archaeon DL31]